MSAPWAEVLVGVLSGLGGALIVLARMAARWSRIEADLSHLSADMHELVQDKDRVHAEMLTQMREDRSVTDRRLRWLEEHLWKRA